MNDLQETKSLAATFGGKGKSQYLTSEIKYMIILSKSVKFKGKMKSKFIRRTLLKVVYQNKRKIHEPVNHPMSMKIFQSKSNL